MKVIIINGYGGSGKDLFVELFDKNYKYKTLNWSSIDHVKDIAMKNFGWKGNKDDKSRKFLSDLKRIWTEYNDGPFLNLKNRIIEFEYNFKVDGQENIYFVHVREPEEINKFVKEFKDDCITLLIRRDVDIPNNSSDQNVENFKYDYIIENNDGILDLELKVINFISKL